MKMGLCACVYRAYSTYRTKCGSAEFKCWLRRGCARVLACVRVSFFLLFVFRGRHQTCLDSSCLHTAQADKHTTALTTSPGHTHTTYVSRQVLASVNGASLKQETHSSLT